MRPIQLKIAGLHSFREMQEVDFATLCQGGVFGIFGPTGSGKSTILDAMTLALYGKVERASNNTMGIMNHAEDRVYVSYTFELRNAKGTQRFQVERAYKRSDEFRLRSTMARLIDLTDRECVLADKDREVTTKIEEILGLTADDFTRAVVLPQGKFAEFLMLQGSERRKMLQRLFQLEKYGDRLLARLKQRREQADVIIKEIIAEQAGLGDCSKERVQEVHQRLQEALAKSKYWRNYREKTEHLYQEKQEIWQKQLERERIEQILMQLQQEEEVYVQKELQIERAKQAERLYPYLEQWMRDEEQERFWQDRLLDTGQAYEKQKTLYEQQQQAYEQARLKRIEREPKLVLQIESLRQAQEINIQLGQLKQRYGEQQKEYDRLLAEKDVLVKESHIIRQKLDRAKQLQQELQEEVERKKVSAEERERVTRALQIKHQYDTLNQEISEIAKELSQKQEQLKVLKEEEQAYQEHLQHLYLQLSYEVNALVLLQQQLLELQATVTQIETQTAQEIKDAQNRRLEEERKALAHQLAAQLQEGSPCPVCGAIDHPNPVKVESIITHAIEELNQLEQRQVELREVRQQVERLIYVIGQLGKSVESVSLSAFVKSEIAYEQDIGDAKQSSFVKRPVKSLMTIKKSLDDYARRVDLLQQTIERLLTESSDVEKRFQESNIHLSHAEKAMGEIQNKLLQKKEKLQELLKLWHENFSDLALDDVEQVSFSLDQRLREVEQLQKRLHNGKQYIEDHEQQWQAKDQSLRELVVTLAKLEAEIQGLNAHIYEYESKIYAVTGGQAIESLLHSALASLRNLQQEEEQLRNLFLHNEQLLRQIESDYKAAQQSLQTSKERHEHSRQMWETQLGKGPFNTKDEVLQAMLTQEEVALLQKTITAYREQRKTHEVKLATLIEELRGQQISEEQWNSLIQQLEQARQEDEQSLQELARSERDYEEILEKHGRWQQLEQRRNETNAELERLMQLQSVLRGNAFVDFIAEEQLMQISRDASERLRQITRGRYAIEVDSSGGFVIADHANGGVKRPVSTLSGGETFLASLALALALSAQVQLKGQYPLEFFFLDEGFGTLDQELLDTVITTLEKLRSDSLSIGLISHVPELKERILRKIVVVPAETGGRGSRIVLQNL